MLCAAEPTVRGCSTGGSTGCRYTVVGGVTVHTCRCADSRCNYKVVAPGGATSIKCIVCSSLTDVHCALNATLIKYECTSSATCYESYDGSKPGS